MTQLFKLPLLYMCCMCQVHFALSVHAKVFLTWQVHNPQPRHLRSHSLQFTDPVQPCSQIESEIHLGTRTKAHPSI